MIERTLFQGCVQDQQLVIDVFNQHLEEVKNSVPDDRLLVYKVSEGWQPLCDFLGVPVPERPFPRSNKRTNFATDLRDAFYSV
jgi:hypothetical protein